ncbi:MAG: hypothetical protein JSW11_14635 [Candidatus Heimdallarchaeota archaeon]|nr:MAG: hypothetical protein JSW11_14635 [Candidatus Heimdallarchaeota archaeon]
MIGVIVGFGYFRNFFIEKAEVPVWEVGDAWIYNSSYQGDLSKGSDIGIFVREITTYKDQKFYQIWGHLYPMFDKSWVSADDLNPIKLEDFENGTFSETDKPFNFPLYKGKKWDFTTQNNHTYRYIVESQGDIKVLGGTFNSFKIRKTEGNKTKSITYFSPKVRNIVKMIIYNDDPDDYYIYQFKSFYNEPFERLIDTQKLDNRYNATLEIWEEKYSPVHDWVIKYRVSYTKNGQNFTARFDETTKFCLDWIKNNTNEEDKILCWWDYGHEIQGYTGREVVIDGPSARLWDTIMEPWTIKNWNKESDVVNVSRALVGTPEDTIEVMNQYNATLLYIKSRELALSARDTGIFYSLVKGAKRNLDDYYEVFVFTSSGDKINVNQVKDFQSITIVSYEIEFKKAYYDSMICKARFGYSGDDISPNGDLDGLPALSEDLYHYPIKPCWNLTNFKVIFRTAMWNPYPLEDYENHSEGWQPMEYLDAIDKKNSKEGISDLSDRFNLNSGNIMLRYFDGAILKGKILYENSTSAEGVNITVTDEYGVPHKINQTDGYGNYSLIVPFGNITITISEGEMDRMTLIGDTLLETNLTVELYQATREEVDLDKDGHFDYYIFKDFEIST